MPTLRANPVISGFFSQETAARLLVVPALTIAFIPFVYLVAWYSHRELEQLRTRFRAAHP